MMSFLGYCFLAIGAGYIFSKQASKIAIYSSCLTDYYYQMKAQKFIVCIFLLFFNILHAGQVPTAEWKRETIYATRCDGLKYSLPLGVHDSAHVYEIETLTPAGETSSTQVLTKNFPVWFSSEDEVLSHVPAAVRRIVQLGQDSGSNQEAFRQYRSLLDSFTFSNTQWRMRTPVILTDAGIPFVIVPQKMPEKSLHVRHPEWEKLSLVVCARHAHDGQIPLVVKIERNSHQEYILCLMSLSTGQLREVCPLANSPCSIMFWHDGNILLLYKSIPRMHFSTGWSVIDSKSGQIIASDHYQEEQKHGSFFVDYYIDDHILYGISDKNTVIQLYPQP